MRWGDVRSARFFAGGGLVFILKKTTKRAQGPRNSVVNCSTTHCRKSTAQGHEFDINWQFFDNSRVPKSTPKGF